MAAIFFAGLVLTAAGSGWYHLRPDDAGLAIDRMAMSVAMAGLLGLATANRISERVGAVLGLGVLVAGPLSVQLWLAGGNVLPWAALQAGAMALVVVLACLRRRPLAPLVHWLPVVGAYALAKVLESADLAVYVFSGGVVSGHSLKHMVAALAAVPVLLALRELHRASWANAASPFLLDAVRRRGQRQPVQVRLHCDGDLPAAGALAAAGHCRPGDWGAVYPALPAACSLPVRAHGDAPALSTLSALPPASVVVGASAVGSPPVALSATGTVLVVKVAESTARGTVYLLERASDGARVSVEVAAWAAGQVSLAPGAAVAVPCWPVASSCPQQARPGRSVALRGGLGRACAPGAAAAVAAASGR